MSATTNLIQACAYFFAPSLSSLFPWDKQVEVYQSLFSNTAGKGTWWILSSPGERRRSSEVCGKDSENQAQKKADFGWPPNFEDHIPP